VAAQRPSCHSKSKRPALAMTGGNPPNRRHREVPQDNQYGPPQRKRYPNHRLGGRPRFVG
jgi:hypothetical protein